MNLQSPAFSRGEAIPDRYSHDGGNASPPLTWEDVPGNAKSLALIVDDPDAPNGTFIHWVVYNIPTSTNELAEGASEQQSIGEARQGKNSFGEIGYGGPKPPSGTHRYFFHLYALDSAIELPPGASREQLAAAMRGHKIEECQYMGKYRRH